MNQVIFVGDRINRHSLIAIIAISEEWLTAHHIKIIKTDFEGLSAIRLKKGSVVAFSFFTGQFPDVFTQVHTLRKANPEITIIAGGPHPSGAPQATLDAGFNYVIRGEAEISLPLFWQALNGEIDFKEVPGLSWYQNQTPIHNPSPPAVDLDRSYYRSKVLHSSFPMEITRGCPYGCNFCQVTQLFGCRMRHRSVENILSNIHKGQRFIRFISPNAFSFGSTRTGEINLDAIARLLEGIRKIDNSIQLYYGSFPAEVRPEDVNDDSVRLIREYTDNVALALGAQSGSNRLLQIMRRHHTAEDVLMAVQTIYRNNLKSKVDFIFGLPGENPDDLQETFKLIETIIPMNTEIRIHTFIPLPGTGFAKMPAGKIDAGTRKQLEQLIGKGVAAGPWLHKEQINQRIDRFVQIQNTHTSEPPACAP